MVEQDAMIHRSGAVPHAVLPNESLQLTSAKSSEALRCSAYRDGSALTRVSCILSWSVATELER